MRRVAVEHFSNKIALGVLADDENVSQVLTVGSALFEHVAGNGSLDANKEQH